MEQNYTIIYTTVDKVSRELIWITKKENIAQNVVQFITNGEWSEAAKQEDNRNWNLDWGLTVQNVFGRTTGMKWVANVIQYYYFDEVVRNITRALGTECVKNQELAKAMLKNALVVAKDRDDKYNAEVRMRNPKFIGADTNVEMLKRAKNRLSYEKKNAQGERTEAYEYAQARTYANIIEEYELFKLLEIRS